MSATVGDFLLQCLSEWGITDVPPLPRITLKNAHAFMSTLRKRDPNALGIIKQSVKELIDEFLPHKG